MVGSLNPRPGTLDLTTPLPFLIEAYELEWSFFWRAEVFLRFRASMLVWVWGGCVEPLGPSTFDLSALIRNGCLPKSLAAELWVGHRAWNPGPIDHNIP